MSTFDIDVSINIVRRKENVVFKSKLKNDSVGLNYLSNDNLNTLNALCLIDKSSTLTANNVQANIDYAVVENIAAYDIQTDQFLITDIFITEYNTANQIALFYKHILTHLPKVEDEINPSYELLSVEVLDETFTKVNAEDIKIDYIQGIVYNNLESAFDKSNNSHLIYYVKYAVRTPLTTCSYIELLNNQPVFTEANYSDLDDEMKIYESRKVYILEEQESSFKVILPVLGKYAFKTLNKTRLRVISPPLLDNANSWNVSISNGRFFTKIRGVTYQYLLAEYNNQLWNPERPYKKCELENSVILSKNLIGLNQENIIINNDNMPIISLVYDKDETLLAAFTTDITLQGQMVSNNIPYTVWTASSPTGIRSIDYKTGILDIEGYNLEKSFTIKSTYYYNDKSYGLNSIDFNPLNNPDILHQKVVLFIDPQGQNEIKNQTLYYLILDKSGKVIKSNWPLFDNEYQYYLGRSISNPFYTISTGGHPPLYYDTVPEFAQLDIGDGKFVWQEIFLNHTVSNLNKLLVLAEISIADNMLPNQGWILDIRNRGGGIKEDAINDLKKINPEVNYYWDIGFFDGTPYPSNGATYIEVPVTVMKGSGGTFTGTELKEVINKHLALGVYPIIRTYGIELILNSIVAQETSIDLNWRFHGIKI